MDILECHGTGAERGQSHGESARDRVRQAVARWEAATLAGPGKPARITDYAEQFLDRTGLFRRLTRTLPDLAAEVTGIARGAGLPEAVMAAYNLMDEQWWYDLDHDPGPPPGCSLIALQTPGGTVIAQNMDLPDFMDGSQVVLRLSGPDQPEALVLSAAGMVGLTGVNRAGVAICVNTLLMLNHQTDGVPVAFVLRRALQDSSAAAALATLQGLDHASGQHFAVAGPSGVTGLECSAGGAVVSCAGQGLLLHTNHPLASADLNADAAEYLRNRGSTGNSGQRLEYLRDHLTADSTAAEVEALLSDTDTPLCLTPDPTRGLQTFGSVLFQLGSHPSAQFRLGLPGQAQWQDVAFRT